MNGFLLRYLLPAFLFVCVFPPPSSRGNPTAGSCDAAGCGHHGSGWHRWRGRPPLPPPYWNYPLLAPGPYTTFDYPFSGWPGGRWTNGPGLHRPPVPVYGPLPATLGSYDLVHPWKHTPPPGWGLGWFGAYFQPSPRHLPLSVSVRPMVEPVPAGVPLATGDGVPESCLIVEVKLPEPTAEVLVDGVKTAQRGTDRLYESPPSEAGKEIRYEMTARWLEGGRQVEETRVVRGKPGEVVRVDFTSPQVVPTGR
jgi:uncharacterized protein (TIGR03000 family)